MDLKNFYVTIKKFASSEGLTLPNKPVKSYAELEKYVGQAIRFSRDKGYSWILAKISPSGPTQFADDGKVGHQVIVQLDLKDRVDIIRIGKDHFKQGIIIVPIDMNELEYNTQHIH